MSPSKTKLEELGEQIMEEIKETKKWNERAVTNEMIDRKLDVIMEIVLDIRDRVMQLELRMENVEIRLNEAEKQIGIVKDILSDHTKRLRRLEARQ